MDSSMDIRREFEKFMKPPGNPQRDDFWEPYFRCCKNAPECNRSCNVCDLIYVLIYCFCIFVYVFIEWIEFG